MACVRTAGACMQILQESMKFERADIFLVHLGQTPSLTQYIVEQLNSQDPSIGALQKYSRVIGRNLGGGGKRKP